MFGSKKLIGKKKYEPFIKSFTSIHDESGSSGSSSSYFDIDSDSEEEAENVMNDSPLLKLLVS